MFETKITYMRYDELSGGIAGRTTDHPFHECLLYFFPPLCLSYFKVQVSKNTPKWQFTLPRKRYETTTKFVCVKKDPF